MKNNNEQEGLKKADKINATTSSTKVVPLVAKVAKETASDLAGDVKNEITDGVKNELNAQATEIADEAKAALSEEVSKMITVVLVGIKT